MKRIVFLAACCATTLAAGAAPLSVSGAPQVIGFGSCAKEGRPQPIWKAINAAKPEIFVMLGDNIYADTTDMRVMAEKYAMLAAEKEFQKLRRNTRMLAVWDDHDFGLNDAGAEYPMKKESQALFMDFFKIPADHPMRSREGVYSAEVFDPPGRRVQFILLDTRYFRSPLTAANGEVPAKKPYVPNPDPTTTLLGPTQWAWLEQQLRQPAEIRLVFSSIQVVHEEHGGEKWMNFPHERQRLFHLLADTKANGVLFLSGDRHLAELSRMDAGIGFPVFDLTSSGFNQAHVAGWRGTETNRHRIAVMNNGNNFGIIRIRWNGPDTEIRLEIHDEEGDLRFCQKVPLKWLTPRPPVR